MDRLYTAWLAAVQAKNTAFMAYRLSIALQAPAWRKAEALAAYSAAHAATDTAWRAYRTSEIAA